MENSSFVKFGWATLIVIFLVIIAGSVVRATGSGMGCPDWPKCFGYLIPPAEEDQVVFRPNVKYEKGQMILNDNKLLYANEAFISLGTFNENDWTAYEKHNYAIFNPTHTWIEYINRLVGALSGLFVLVFFGWSIILAWRRRLSWFIPFGAFVATILLGFQAWLGKTVVDSNLEGAKITAHLFGALALVGLMLVLIRFSTTNSTFSLSKKTKRIAWVAFILLMIQVFLGTEFRIHVDEWNKHISELFELQAFKLHRSFAWFVLLSCIWLFYTVLKEKKWSFLFTIMAILLISEIGIGIILSRFDLPAVAQPFHLLIASILFSCFVWVLMTKSKF